MALFLPLGSVAALESDIPELEVVERIWVQRRASVAEITTAILRIVTELFEVFILRFVVVKLILFVIAQDSLDMV